MGTNYYVLIPEFRGLEDLKLHIGKSSGGWTFSFRGYRRLEEFPSIIIDESDWKKILLNVQIIDEYGEEISYKDFWSLVYSKKAEKLNHAKLTIEKSPLIFPNNAVSEEYINQNWLDSWGNSFTDGEFC